MEKPKLRYSGIKSSKRNKSIWIRTILGLLLLTLFSYLISFLVTNKGVLKLPLSERILQEIDISKDNITYESFTLENNKFKAIQENPSIIIDLQGRYVEKFNYKYEIDDNVDVEVVLIERNAYGDPQEVTSSDRLLTDINISSQSIRNYVYTIELKFQSNELVIHNLQIDNRTKLNSYLFLIIFITGLIILISFLFRKQIFKKTENVFLLVATTTGLLFILLLPNRLGLSWDDQIHFQYIYSLSQKGMVKWTQSPFHLIDRVSTNNFSFLNTPEERAEARKFLNTNHDYSKAVAVLEKKNLFDYTKLTYYPLALIFRTADSLGLPFTISLVLSKLTNLLIYVITIYFTIKITPIFKKGFTYIALLPGPMFLATQFSCDPLITAFFFLAIAVLLKMILEEKPVTWRELLLFIMSIVIAASPKGVYIIPLLLLPLLPREKFKDNKQRNWISIIVVIVFLLVLSSFLLPRISGSTPFTDTRGGDADSIKQMLLIKEQPFSFLRIFSKNIFTEFFYKFIGIGTIGHFAYVGTITSFNLYYLSLFFLSFFVITDTYNQDSQKHIPIKIKVAMAFVILSIISSIWAILYLSFTPTRETTINGVQGRYFIPLLPLVFLIINSYYIKTKIPEKTYNWILLISTTFLLIGSISTMILKPYCF